ncbi:hypothetical protein O5265_18165 [Escherichia coli]|nr:hypothetical protein [Escherichia coli]
MDRLIYQGTNYLAVVAMHSNRTGSYECINNENLKGQRTSDGMTWLYLPNDDQYRDYWPVVDSRFYQAPPLLASRVGVMSNTV